MPSTSLSAVQTLSQLSFLLEHFQLQSLNAISQSFLALAHNPGAQLVFATELPALCRRLWYAAHRVVRPGKPSLLQLRASLERLDAAFLALNLSIGTAEEKCDVGPNLVAQGSLCRSERGLGNELVVLQGMEAEGLARSTTMYSALH